MNKSVNQASWLTTQRPGRSSEEVARELRQIAQHLQNLAESYEPTVRSDRVFVDAYGGVCQY